MDDISPSMDDTFKLSVLLLYSKGEQYSSQNLTDENAIHGLSNVIRGCHPWMEKCHPWMEVSSVDAIHGCHPWMKTTDDGHGRSQNCMHHIIQMRIPLQLL